MRRMGHRGDVAVIRFALILLGFLLSSSACVPPEADAPGSAQVLLLGDKQLAPPLVGEGPLRKPAVFADIDPTAPEAGQAAGFFLTVATGDATGLQARLTDRQTGLFQTVQRVAPPETQAERALATTPRAFNPTVTDLLRDETAVFWSADDTPSVGGYAHRFAVLIPRSRLSPFTRFSVFNQVGDDGTPLRAASFELVRDFFYMAVIGDSVAWGNGLDDRNKFSTLVANTIEEETGRRVIRQVYAQSGAAIVPDEEDGLCEVNCSGEAPAVDTSITVQADRIDRPDVMELILLDGCINDVGVSTILFDETPDAELTALTERFCQEEMIVLLQKVRSLAPQTHIVVTAYFPVVSVESDLFGVHQWVLAQREAVSDDVVEIKEELVSQSGLFYETSLQSLSAAVDAVNAMDDLEDRIIFAPVDFGLSNATFASDSWLWGLTAENELAEPLEIELKLFPEDQVVDFRSLLCGQGETLGDVITCLYASVGHPNVSGARAYAEAILEELRAGSLLAEWGAAEGQ